MIEYNCIILCSNTTDFDDRRLLLEQLWGMPFIVSKSRFESKFIKGKFETVAIIVNGNFFLTAAENYKKKLTTEKNYESNFLRLQNAVNNYKLIFILFLNC